MNPVCNVTCTQRHLLPAAVCAQRLGLLALPPPQQWPTCLQRLPGMVAMLNIVQLMVCAVVSKPPTNSTAISDSRRASVVPGVSCHEHSKPTAQITQVTFQLSCFPQALLLPCMLLPTKDRLLPQLHCRPTCCHRACSGATCCCRTGFHHPEQLRCNALVLISGWAALLHLTKQRAHFCLEGLECHNTWCRQGMACSPSKGAWHVSEK